MDYYNTIIGMSLLVISLAPFIWLSKMNNKNRAKLNLHIAGMATTNLATVAEKDTLLDLAIGLDTHGKHLFFIKNDKQITIDLALYHKCEFYDTRITTKKGVKKTEIITTIGIKFIPIAVEEVPLWLEFYNLKEKTQPNGEFELAKKWSNLVDSKL